MAGFQLSFGPGAMWGERIDLTGSGIGPRQFGLMQDVTIDFDFTDKELYGQMQFPAAIARGQGKITGKAKIAQINGLLYSDIFWGLTPATGQFGVAQAEPATIPAATSPVTIATSAATAIGDTLTFASTTGVVLGQAITDTTTPSVIPVGTYVVSFNATQVVMSNNVTGAGVGSGDSIDFSTTQTVTVTNAATYNDDLGVTYASGADAQTRFNRVASPVAAGQYSVDFSTGVYTFSAFDASAAVLISYTYSITDTGLLLTLTNQFTGTTPWWKGTFYQKISPAAPGLAGTSLPLALRLNACTSSKMGFATTIDNWEIPELDFMAAADASGIIGYLSVVQQ